MLTKRSENTYIARVDERQVTQMKRDLAAQGYALRENVPHAFFAAGRNGVSLTAFRNEIGRAHV